MTDRSTPHSETSDVPPAGEAAHGELLAPMNARERWQQVVQLADRLPVSQGE